MKKFKNLIYLLTALVPFLTLAQTNPRMLDQGTPTTGTRDVSVRKVEKRLNIPITTGTEAGLYPDVPIKGAIRLNSATNLFEYHDGTIWKAAGASTQDNIDIVKVVLYTSTQQSQRFSASQTINNLPQFTLTETQSLWLKVMPDLTVSENLNPVFLTTKYKVFNKGKGTYGIGGSIQLEESDVELMYSNQLIVGDIINLESTDIISITSLAGQTISQYVNSHAPAYIIQSQSEGYTIFQIGTDPDNLISYLYLGEGGTFGQGSGQTTDADFQLLNNSAELPAEQGLQEVTDVGTISIYNEAGLTSAVALNTPGQEGRESAFKYNDGDKNSDVRITKSLILLRNDSSVLGKVSEVSLENGELAFNVIGSNLGESYTYQTRFPTPTENVFMNFPNKPSGDYTLATLDDIPTGGNQDLQSVLNEGSNARLGNIAEINTDYDFYDQGFTLNATNPFSNLKSTITAEASFLTLTNVASDTSSGSINLGNGNYSFGVYNGTNTLTVISPEPGDTGRVTPMVISVNNTFADEFGNVPLTIPSSSTNLTYTASPTNGIVNSDTGTDATIPLADATNAGLLSPSEKTAIGTIASRMVNPMTSAGDLIYGGASGVPTRLANTGNTAWPLLSGGGTNAPYYGQINLQVGSVITGVGPVSNGFTGRNTGGTANSLVATGTTATGAQQTIANSTSGFSLFSNGTALPSFRQIAQTDISGLTTSLGLKANDADVLHKAGVETIADNKLVASSKSINFFNERYGIGTPDGGLQIYSATFDVIRFGARAADLTFTEHARFNGATGYFGIGINPTERLDVAGNGKFDSIILVAPDGGKWKISVSNTGVLSTASIP